MEKLAKTESELEFSLKEVELLKLQLHTMKPKEFMRDINGN